MKIRNTYSLFLILTLIFVEASAQNFLGLGPFDIDESEIVLYLNPDVDVLNKYGNPASYGQSVYKWIDQSQNHFVFENTLNSRRPEFVQDNGHNYLDFTPGDFLENVLVKDSINNLEELSIFIVVKSNVTHTDNGFIDSENPDGNDDVIALRYDADGINTGRTNCLKAGLNSNNPANQVETQSNTQTTDRQVLTITWKRHERTLVYINGIVSDSSASVYSGVISDVKKIIVGKGPKDVNSTNGWNGKIGTILFYNKKFTPEVVSSIAAALPVELISFNAKQNINSVVLSWTTAAEYNNDFFTIEKSSDGLNYITLTKVKGNGNSSNTNNYEYTDSDISSGNYYYLLSQTDFNGKHKNIGIVNITINAVKNNLILYPNLVTHGNEVKFKLPEAEENGSTYLIIRNSCGQICFQEILDKAQPHNIVIGDNFIHGIYFVTILSESDSFTEKLVIY